MIIATNKLPREVEFDVYFSDKKLNRSLPQNRYLWGVVYKTLSDSTGYEVEELHEMCKVKFSLRTKFDLFGGELIEVPQSTKMMDTKQMGEYIDKIRAWSSQSLNIYIPQPNEITDEHLIESKHYT